MSAPTVAAIIPVRDGERYLGAAIDSILAQTRPVDEVIVADNGSSDGSATVAEAYGGPVRCLRLEPRGPGAGVDSALADSSAEVIALLDADDLWVPDRVEAQLAALGSSTAPDLLWGHVEQFVSPDLGAEERARLRPPVAAGPAKIRGTLMARREVLERVGRFEVPGVIVGEFIDWYMRAQDAGLSESMAEKVVLRRRIHASNLGRTMKDSREEYAQVIAAARKRRRS